MDVARTVQPLLQSFRPLHCAAFRLAVLLLQVCALAQTSKSSLTHRMMLNCWFLLRAIGVTSHPTRGQPVHVQDKCKTKTWSMRMYTATVPRDRRKSGIPHVAQRSSLQAEATRNCATHQQHVGSIVPTPCKATATANKLKQ
jgi:hypothetical protein